MIPQLTGCRLHQALEALHTIPDHKVKAEILINLCSSFYGDQKKDLLQQALEAAQSIEDHADRARALIKLSPRLDDEKWREAIRQAWEAADAITDDYWRMRNFSELAAQMDGLLKALAIDEATDAAQSIINQGIQTIKIVQMVLPFVDEGQKADLIRYLLRQTDAMTREDEKAFILHELAPYLYLSNDLLDQSWQIALKINDKQFQIRAIEAIAPELNEKLLRKGLEEVKAISPENIERGAFLRALAPRLEGELLGLGVDAALEIWNEREQAETLAALLPQLKRMTGSVLFWIR